jgi:hypothetical protein
MLRRLSKLTFLIQFLIFLGLAALLWVPEFMHPKVLVRVASEGVLYSSMSSLFQTYPYVTISLALALVIGLSITLYLIGSVNDILPRENFLPAIVYLFLLSWNSSLSAMNPLLPAGLLIAVSIFTLMRMYGQSEPYRQVFIASALIGLASLFYFPAMYFLIMVWISLVTYRITSWREWIIAFIGFLIPFIYLISWYFWNDEFILILQKIIASVDNPGITLRGIENYEIVWLVLTVFLLIITLSIVINLVQDKLISIRRRSFIMINFVVACSIMILLSGSSLLLVSKLLYMPLAFFIATSLSMMKKSIVLDIMIITYLLFLASTRLFILNG